VARETFKIKEMFLNLQNKKIENIQKIISSKTKSKPKLNITTKEPSMKQVIIPINVANTRNLIKDSSLHMSNINRVLKNIKSEVMANFIYSENRGVVITTNKVAGTLNLQIIKRYVKNINNIEANQMKVSRLPQLKSFLKIIGIPYLMEDTYLLMTADMVKKIMKENHIFNNIILVSRLRVITVLPKFNISIVVVDSKP